jgi:nucleoside-diphosphate-sugar epimerase
MALLRLNYATELRYGVLVDLAQQIAAGREVDLSMSYVNVIWLADANAMALLAFSSAATPARIINLSGPEILSVREVCSQLARQMGTTARFVGTEHEDALLNNGQLGYRLLGHPAVSADQMVRWTARWVAGGSPTLDKPTHFQNRSGQF